MPNKIFPKKPSGEELWREARRELEKAKEHGRKSLKLQREVIDLLKEAERLENLPKKRKK